jgi:hypothetical protein
VFEHVEHLERVENREHRATRPAPGDAVGSDPFPPVPHPAGLPRGAGASFGPALPQPRTDEPSGRAGHTPGGTAGRGLRRRVPQSHLAPELRHADGAGLADTAAPMSADAAATALSRYQASRMAAQAVVDTVGPAGPNREGEHA